MNAKNFPVYLDRSGSGTFIEPLPWLRRSRALLLMLLFVGTQAVSAQTVNDQKSGTSNPTEIVKGRPPTVLSVELGVHGEPLGTQVRIGDTVEATLQGFNDSDGDAESGTSYKWELNGVTSTTTSNTFIPRSLGNLVVEVTPRTDPATSDPSIGTPVASSAKQVYAAVVGNFIPPDGTRRTWGAANSFCQAKGMRLGTRNELKNLFTSYTSATVADGSQINTEMCTLYGWRLNQVCGGNSNRYWSSDQSSTNIHFNVELNSGIVSTNGDASSFYTTCVP